MALNLDPGDKVTLRKKHPCGSDLFTVSRVGADCRAVCSKCGSSISMSRHNFEKAIKKIEKICAASQEVHK